MQALRQHIRGCSAALEAAEASHFAPEWGGRIAAAALAAFADPKH